MGDVYRGKVLGCFCLIDQGELDWKILVVDAEEAKRENVSIFGGRSIVLKIIRKNR